MPKISILTPSFNHEKYVGMFLDSVLNQTFKDFELILVDDCSTDKNLQEIAKYKDVRITLIKHSFNQGINASLNTAFKNSSGEVLVFIASDDLLESYALETMYQAHCQNDIVTLYTPLTPIDEENQVVEEWMNGYVNMQPQSKEMFLRTTFLERNVFVSPGMSVKRKFFKKVMPLPVSLMNYQDYLLHIELLRFGEIGVLSNRLVRYRIPRQNGNQASSPSLSAAIRETLETHMFMDAYLKFNDLALLERAFSKEIAQTGIKPYAETLQFFWGVMALCSTLQIRKIWGYHQIMKFYNTKGAQEILYKKYHFTFANLLQLTKFFGA